MKKLICTLCIAAMLLAVMGCWGPMQLTRGFDDWVNQQYVDGPWLAQLMFYLPIIPIAFVVTGTIDILILNLLDFWGESAFRGTGTPYMHRNPAVPDPR